MAYTYEKQPLGSGKTTRGTLNFSEGKGKVQALGPELEVGTKCLDLETIQKLKVLGMMK
jgi:hypothetical protein